MMSSSTTSIPFRTNAVQALRNATLRGAMRNATETFTIKRAEALSGRASGGMAGRGIRHASARSGQSVRLRRSASKEMRPGPAQRCIGRRILRKRESA